MMQRLLDFHPAWRDVTAPSGGLKQEEGQMVPSYITISHNVWAPLTHSPLFCTSCKKLGVWKKKGCGCILKLCRSDNRCCQCLGNHVPSSKFVIQPSTFFLFQHKWACTQEVLRSALASQAPFYFFFALWWHRSEQIQIKKSTPRHDTRPH